MVLLIRSSFKKNNSMNKLFLFFAAALVFNACTIDPCLTKGQFLKGYEMLTDKVAEDYKSISDKEWMENDEKMVQFIDECYKKHESKLTEDEKKDFWIKYFKYKFYRHGKNFLKAVETDVKDYSLDLEEELEDLFDNPEEDLKKILNELYGGDVKEVIDDFVEGINELADKLKEWLEKE